MNCTLKLVFKCLWKEEKPNTCATSQVLFVLVGTGIFSFPNCCLRGLQLLLGQMSWVFPGCSPPPPALHAQKVAFQVVTVWNAGRISGMSVTLWALVFQTPSWSHKLAFKVLLMVVLWWWIHQECTAGRNWSCSCLNQLVNEAINQ